jgi:hypothetical protein
MGSYGQANSLKINQITNIKNLNLKIILIGFFEFKLLIKISFMYIKSTYNVDYMVNIHQ